MATFLERANQMEKEFATYPMIRAVNFHSTAKVNADRYDRQLAEYAKHFTSVNEDEMLHYLETGEWHKSKPGLIVSVFEGYRNSYEVLVPLIEKHGFTGWFWMIATFLNTPIADQLNYADHHDIDMLTHEYPDGRYALTWEELREIGRKHVVASHARNHIELAKQSPEVQRAEILGSQEDFVKNLGHPVRGFVSLLGPSYGETTPEIDGMIKEAGYKYVLSNMRIQRIQA